MWAKVKRLFLKAEKPEPCHIVGIRGEVVTGRLSVRIGNGQSEKDIAVDIPFHLRGPANRFLAGVADAQDVGVLHDHILKHKNARF